ncbi:MFS transporter [beta proteobacterium AAP99]|nr:MFS transporter [beta proteobacterium AAP99]
MTGPSPASVPAAAASSAWSPFGHRVFAVMWTAMLLGNIGTWMRDVGAGWLMTTLSPSATMVALVQVAGTLPIFLLSLPAGALADLVDRRRLLIGVNVLLAAVAVVLGVLTQLKLMTPTLLVLCLLVGGIGTALMTPVLQSLTPLQVPKSELRNAIALNSMGFNVARAIGPALGGLIIAAVSIHAAFYIDAISYVVVIAALLWWKAASTPASTEAPEAFGSALRTGLRFALNAPELKRTLLRAASFFVFASSYWALLPIIARKELGGGASYYGILLACIGAGAVLGALLLPKLRARISAEATLRLGTVLTIAVLVLLATVRDQIVAAVALGLAGMAWIAVLTTANTAAQTVLPNWVRGRGLAVYLTVFYGAMTAGSLIWGQVADHVSVQVALLAAAGVGLLALAIAFARPMPESERDLTPSMHWPEPAMKLDAADDAPVMVSIDYRIEPAQREAFLAALDALGGERRRDGAVFWQVFEDTEAPGHFTELFMEPSWAEHLRHHHRVTQADADLQASVQRFHIGAAPPVVRHLLARR